MKGNGKWKMKWLINSSVHKSSFIICNLHCSTRNREILMDIYFSVQFVSASPPPPFFSPFLLLRHIYLITYLFIVRYPFIVFFSVCVVFLLWLFALSSMWCTTQYIIFCCLKFINLFIYLFFIHKYMLLLYFLCVCLYALGDGDKMNSKIINETTTTTATATGDERDIRQIFHLWQLSQKKRFQF